jgi:nucleolar protein 4
LPNSSNDRKSMLKLENQGLTFRGRQLHVLPAIGKEDVEKLKVIDRVQNKTIDKRNLYLLNEGQIQPGTLAAKGLSKSDIERREQAEREKRAKLRNPNYAVSRTRLCFRNLPLSLDEKTLKALIKKATSERMHQEDCPEKDMPNSDSKITIRQVKIARSKDRVDKMGSLRSKGYAFVEFSEHVHALACLRQLNNNPTIFGEKKRPIIEFAVDNILILKKRTERNNRSETKKNHTDQAGSDKGESSTSMQKQLSRTIDPKLTKHCGTSRKSRTPIVKPVSMIPTKTMGNPEHNSPQKKINIKKVRNNSNVLYLWPI